MSNLIQISDTDIWPKLDNDDLWIYDKLILSKKLGYDAGPAGIPVSREGWYIVRPITNLKMMSRGAYKTYLKKDNTDIPDGYFWCEYFEGRHISIDYNFGIQKLTVEGFRRSDRLDRFSRWTKINYNFELPEVLQDIASRHEWLNIEMIGDKVIEAHLRYNDDFQNHDGTTIVPVWKEDDISISNFDRWYESPCGDRLGFLVYE